MKKILLIGGGGSIGKALTNEFISKNYYVTIIDSIPFKNQNKTKNVKYICVNFDSLNLNQLIKSHDVFFYLLSRLLPGDNNLDKFYLDISSYIRFTKNFSNHVGKKLILFSLNNFKRAASYLSDICRFEKSTFAIKIKRSSEPALRIKECLNCSRNIRLTEKSSILTTTPSAFS